MSFFNRSKIHPPPNNGIKLQEFDNNDSRRANEHGIDGSGDYSVNKAAVLCFLCDYHFEGSLSNRLVTFKGFIEDLQFKLNIEYEEGGSNFSPITEKYLKGYKFGYNLVFNVVAHSVNDAMSNMARYSELERILMYPFTGPQNRGSSNSAIRIPNAYVFMSNLINNGLLGYNNKYEKIQITNAFVRKHGLRAAVSSIKLDPDLEMGVFEFNNQTYFKSFKVSMEIPITNDLFGFSYNDEIDEKNEKFKMLFPYIKRKDKNNKIYYGHKQNASYNENSMPKGQLDSKGFPFCVPFSSTKILTSYAQGVKAYGSNKRTALGICINSNDITQNENPNITRNYCVFDAFIESYSYERTQNGSERTSFKDVSSNRTDFMGKGVTIFNLSVNVPAYSVIDAEANCMKINSLFRMISIQKTERLPGGPVKILLNNLIKGFDKRGSNGLYTFNDIYSNGLACYVNSLNVSVDLDAGFFEYNQYFLPKALKLDMQIVYTKNDKGHIFIDFEGTDREDTWKPDDSVLWPFGIKYNDT
jgi:hypothetical protein